MAVRFIHKISCLAVILALLAGQPFNGFTAPSSSGTASELPPYLGTMEESLSGTGPSVIHIQTAHGSYAVEQKVREILQYLKESRGIKVILAEGSAFRLDSDRIRFFPEDPQLTGSINEALTKDGLVKGAELFLLENPDAAVYGLEDLAVYVRNGRAAEAVMAKKDSTAHFIKTIRRSFFEAARSSVNSRLWLFMKKMDRFHRGLMSMEEWLHYLKNLSRQALDIDPAEAAFEKKWPLLGGLFQEKAMLKHEIKNSSWQKEIDSLERVIRESLTGSGRDRTTFEIYKNLLSLERLLTLSLAPSDYTAVSERRELLHPEKILSSIQEIHGAGAEASLMYQAKELGPVYGNALTFYELAAKRDRLLFENAEKRIAETGVSSAVLITGGFHADALKALFSQNGYSYSFITPNMEKWHPEENSAEAVYAKGFTFSALESPFITDPYIILPQSVVQRSAGRIAQALSKKKLLHKNGSGIEAFINSPQDFIVHGLWGKDVAVRNGQASVSRSELRAGVTLVEEAFWSIVSDLSRLRGEDTAVDSEIAELSTREYLHEKAIETQEDADAASPVRKTFHKNLINLKNPIFRNAVFYLVNQERETIALADAFLSWTEEQEHLSLEKDIETSFLNPVIQALKFIVWPKLVPPAIRNSPVMAQVDRISIEHQISRDSGDVLQQARYLAVYLLLWRKQQSAIKAVSKEQVFSSEFFVQKVRTAAETIASESAVKAALLADDSEWLGIIDPQYLTEENIRRFLNWYLSGRHDPLDNLDLLMRRYEDAPEEVLAAVSTASAQGLLEIRSDDIAFVIFFAQDRIFWSVSLLTYLKNEGLLTDGASYLIRAQHLFRETLEAFDLKYDERGFPRSELRYSAFYDALREEGFEDRHVAAAV